MVARWQLRFVYVLCMFFEMDFWAALKWENSNTQENQQKTKKKNYSKNGMALSDGD